MATQIAWADIKSPQLNCDWVSWTISKDICSSVLGHTWVITVKRKESNTLLPAWWPCQWFNMTGKHGDSTLFKERRNKLAKGRLLFHLVQQNVAY